MAERRQRTSDGASRREYEGGTVAATHWQVKLLESEGEARALLTMGHRTLPHL